MADPISSIIDLVDSAVTRIWPDKTKASELQADVFKQQLSAQLQRDLSQTDLLRGQIDTNREEAKNPNRTWITWRELLGYMLVFALAYQWFLLPIISLVAQLAGHALDLTKIYTIDILDVVYILGGMLGLDLGPVIANKLRGIKK